MDRFLWWAPWRVTDPWKPGTFVGCDEWHNTSRAISIPFLGTFIFFYGPFSREGEEHLHAYGPEGWEGRDVETCGICREINGAIIGITEER